MSAQLFADDAMWILGPIVVVIFLYLIAVLVMATRVLAALLRAER